MPQSDGSGLGLSELAALVQRRDAFGLAREADLARRQLHGARSSFALVFHLDLASGSTWCPICGAEPGAAGAKASSVDPGEARKLATELAHPALGDLHVLLPAGVEAPQLVELAQALREALPQTATFQLGSACQLMDTASDSPQQLLKQLADVGLRVVSDGVRPTAHAGSTDVGRWEGFWRAAADSGLCGGASILYGADLTDDELRTRLEAVARVQQDTRVFTNVAPVVHNPQGYGGIVDTMLTQGLQDLRVLAACRLGLPEVPHLRLLYNRSDLKMAHTSLASGADDLEGNLFPAQRTVKEDTEAKDLSVVEIAAWLRDGGFDPAPRNGMFEPLPAAAEESA